MSKVLVSVFVPVVAREYDVFIPYESTIGAAAAQLRSILGDDEVMGGEAIRDAVLCARDTGEVLDPRLTPQEACLGNAARLMLI